MSQGISTYRAACPCNFASVGKGTLVIISVAILAIGIAGLTHWDFAQKLSFEASLSLTITGGILTTLALWLILRKPKPEEKPKPPYIPTGPYDLQDPALKLSNESTFLSALKEDSSEANSYIKEVVLREPQMSCCQDRESNTALHLVAQKPAKTLPDGRIDFGCLHVINRMIDLGAPIDAVNNKRQTPLHLAVLARNYAAVLSLCNHNRQKVPIDAPDHEGNTPLHYAYAAFRDNNKGEYTVKTERSEKDSRQAILDKLLRMGANTTLKNLQGELPQTHNT